MAEILKVLHLTDQYRVADVNIRGSRIETRLHAQRLARLLRPLQLFEEFLFANNLDSSATDVRQLLFSRNCFEIIHVAE